MLDKDVGNITSSEVPPSAAVLRESSVRVTAPASSHRYHTGVWERLEREDAYVAALIHQEYQRQQDTLQLIADSGGTIAESNETNNTTTKTMTWQTPGQPDLTPYPT